MNVKPKETELVHNCMAILDALGVRCLRRNVVGRPWVDKRGRRRVVRSGAPGQADIWGIGPGGQHWEVEIKVPGEFPELEQWLWLRECHALGAIAFWVDSTLVLESIARGILAGGRIVWLDGASYHVQKPPVD